MDILLSSLVGKEAFQKYVSTDGEWIDGKRNNTLFISADSEDRSLPPVLVSVQYTVDKSFLRCLTGYALHIYDQYKKEPIVLTLCINKTNADVVSNFSDSSIPYMKLLPSVFWAKKHCIITPTTLKYYLDQEHNITNNNESVANSDNSSYSRRINISNNNKNSGNNLPALAAVALVLMSQKQSMFKLPHYKNDPTVKLCHEIYDNEIRRQESVGNVYVKVATQTQTQFKRIMEQVDQDGPNMRKKIKELSNEGIIFTETYLYKSGEQEQESISTSPPIPRNDHKSNLSSKITVALPLLPSNPTDMEFVNHWKREYMKTHKRMNWATCFEEGRNAGLLSAYKNQASLKNTYNKKYPSL
ncbi:hypothetical protein INT45_004761 [Circinella minor]|uniref:Uncharacterized protein n=1 Tax=Circinella minor TaxID=1195481 RepID=A0A8H7SE42_9FUNG|nr:hypothetical protein INT45_004761 [Circinella minor]